MRSKFWTILEGLMLIIWIITTIFFLIAAFSDEIKCKANPLVYGVKYLGDKNNATMTCLCKFDNEPDYTIIVNKKEWILNYTGIPTTYQLSPFSFNLSYIEG